MQADSINVSGIFFQGLSGFMFCYFFWGTRPLLQVIPSHLLTLIVATIAVASTICASLIVMAAGSLTAEWILRNIVPAILAALVILLVSSILLMILYRKKWKTRRMQSKSIVKASILILALTISLILLVRFLSMRFVETNSDAHDSLVWLVIASIILLMGRMVSGISAQPIDSSLLRVIVTVLVFLGFFYLCSFFQLYAGSTQLEIQTITVINGPLFAFMGNYLFTRYGSYKMVIESPYISNINRIAHECATTEKPVEISLKDRRLFSGWVKSINDFGQSMELFVFHSGHLDKDTLTQEYSALGSFVKRSIIFKVEEIVTITILDDELLAIDPTTTSQQQSKQLNLL